MTHHDGANKDLSLALRLLNVLLVARTSTGLISRLEGRRLAVASKGRVRHPLARVARRRLLEHVVHLLKRKALRLGDKEVGKHNARRARGTPDEEDFGLEIAVLLVNHVWRTESD